MPSHALHSPNISKAEMRAYLSTRQPLRNKQSLIDNAHHDHHLVKFMQSPLDPRLVQELIKTTERVIRIPSDLLNPGAPLTPPVTPVKSSLSQQQAALKGAPIPIHLSPKWKPLDQFVIRLIEASNVRVATLSYALIVLDRLKEKLPPLAQGMHCTRHRIFLAALVVASKYLNDSTPKNKHWHNFARGLFDTCEITLMEKQMLGLLEFDLRITEAQLVARLSPFLQPISFNRSRARQDATKVQDAARRQLPPLTPITPITPSNMASLSAPAPKAAPAAVERSNVADQAFVLQPVPAMKKRGEKVVSAVKMTNRSTSLSSSQSAPLDALAKQEVAADKESSSGHPFLALPSVPLSMDFNQSGRKVIPAVRGSVAMPLVRSFSSDGLLEGAGSMTMHSARTFSSNASSSMTSSSSISASTSTSHSEVATPGDRTSAWVDESSSQHYFQAHAFGHESAKSLRFQRRGSESATGSVPFPTFIQGETDNHSGLMNKLIGVGKSLSPSRRVGHGVKGDRKVSTATIVPDEVSVEN